MAQLKTGLDKVRSFVDRVLEKVPEADRAALQADFSRTHDEVATLDDLIGKVQGTAVAQKAWWDTNKPKVDDYDRIKSELEGTPKGGVDEKTLGDKLAAARDETLSTGLALITEATTIAGQHLKEFGDPLDMRVLATDAMKEGKTLQQKYDETVAPKRLERDTAARTAEIAAAELRGRTAAISELSKTQMPYPVGNQGAIHTLDGLKTGADGKTANPDHTLDAAVATALAVGAGQH